MEKMRNRNIYGTKIFCDNEKERASAIIKALDGMTIAKATLFLEKIKEELLNSTIISWNQ